jgi:hypothetical protein
VAGHPFADTTFTVGISDDRGGGRTGWAPVPSATDRRAVAPHPEMPRAIIESITQRWNATIFVILEMIASESLAKLSKQRLQPGLQAGLLLQQCST